MELKKCSYNFVQNDPQFSLVKIRYISRKQWLALYRIGKLKATFYEMELSDSSSCDCDRETICA